MLAPAKAEPTAWKASLLGMKRVRSGTISSWSIRPAWVRAPSAAVALSRSAVSDALSGMVRTSSILWMVTPPTVMSWWSG